MPSLGVVEWRNDLDHTVRDGDGLDSDRLGTEEAEKAERNYYGRSYPWSLFSFGCCRSCIFEVVIIPVVIQFS
jgi:hypothetical protein